MIPDPAVPVLYLGATSDPAEWLRQLLKQLLEVRPDIRGGEQRTHDLSARLEAVLEAIPDPMWREQLNTLIRAADLEPAAVASRYPVEIDTEVLWPADRYGQAETEWALDLAQESLETGRTFIRRWTEEEPSV
ncbi:MAG: hypothetical protein N2508_07760 [Anaerolineae bacterium]|nr:hypothetical protein [Anaerolineae bacterium]